MKEVNRYRKIAPVLIYLLAVFFLSYTTDESITLVLLGMMPALINLFVLIYFDPNKKENHFITIIAPVALSFVFLIIWRSTTNPAIVNMDGPTVAFLNVILGYFMMLFFIKWKKEKKVKEKTITKTVTVPETNEYKEQAERSAQQVAQLRQKVSEYENALNVTSNHAKTTSEQIAPLREAIAQYQKRIEYDARQVQYLKNKLIQYEMQLSTEQSKTGEIEPLREAIKQYQARVDADTQELERLRGLVADYAHELHITKKEVQKSIRTIEDKCKAINFVIGRVYADKKGGSAQIRERINIPRDLYNSFSEILMNPKKEDESKLKKVLHLIIDRLETLEQKESDVIKLKKARVDVERKKTDTILDVLSKNDNDPIIDYYTEAKMICEKILEII